ncbi:MAG: glycosyltransferase [Alphaproteobacteria bacterium]|nr:MAG: glycosyltransferase [Alphaproteobacteria bacterium]
MTQKRLKVVFCWSTISGYMAACWRALTRHPEVELSVLAHRPGASTHAAFAEEIMEGIPCRLLDDGEKNDAALIESWVVGQKPDIVVTTGWWLSAYRRLVDVPVLRRCAFMTGVDTPWRTPLQYVNRFRVGRYLRRLDRVVVAGERAWQHMRRLGVPEQHLGRGQYGVDWQGLGSVVAKRAAADWPRRFLFVGRYVTEKGLDVLVEAYLGYRALVDDPWPLECCGRGPLGSMLSGQPGIKDRGFVQPIAMHERWRHAGVFVIPSRFDPWPLALVEAAAAGLPIIATEACGSGVELLRERFNGLFVPTSDVQALAMAMVHMHQKVADLPEWGERSRMLASAYSAEAWVERWIGYFRAARDFAG